MAVQPDSFTFAGVDMLEVYGIRLIAYDVIQPKLRPRKKTIPGRSGAYDFGARWYDERTLRLVCDSMRGLSRQDMRELSALLSRKGNIILWDEPDKYYVGRLYNPEQLKNIAQGMYEFTLNFICDPFAYGRRVVGPLPEPIEYAGTAPTPTYIQVINTGTTAIRGVTMTICREKRG